MKCPRLPHLLGACLLCATTLAWGEKADRDQPMQVQADHLRYDNINQISIFSGNVLVTKGSIVIRGAKLDVRQDADGFQHGIVSAAPGSQAFFRQKREGMDEFVEGQAQTIDYDSRQDSVKFITQAQVRRYRGTTLADQFNADLIVYNNNTEVFTLDGKQGAHPANPKAGRVTAVLTPTVSASPASAPAAAAPASVASSPSAPASQRGSKVKP